MTRPGHETANFFVGTEIEHSPVLGHRTLFVVGLQPTEQILWQIGEANQRSKTPVTHVYFGANQSFPTTTTNQGDIWQPWESMIQTLLERGYWCTLDLDVSCAEGLCESALTEYPRFIPMLSVKLPYVRLLGYNATIKIDDQGFEATNPGVWCHSLHELMNRECFTSWDQYSKDEVVK